MEHPTPVGKGHHNPLLFFFLFLLLTITPTHQLLAVETDIRGFIALDALAIEKQEGRRQSAEMGIGHFDVKLFADYDDFHMRVSLYMGRSVRSNSNFDTSFLDEALFSWSPNYANRITFGKGRVPFHQRRRGVIDSGYISGGSILNTRHNLRDQKNKILVTYRHGSFSKKFFNHLTFFGDTRQAQVNFDDPSQPNIRRSFDEIQYRSNDSFNTKNEAGLANRFEFIPFRGAQLAMAGLWYRRKIDQTPTYAFDVSGRLFRGNWNFYTEYVWAFVNTHPNDRHAAKRQYEQIAQFGGEYRINRQWALAFNLESAWVKNHAHDRNDYPSPDTADCDKVFCYGQSFDNDGETSLITSQKAEIGVRRRYGRSLQITSGVMYEQQQQRNMRVRGERIDRNELAAYRFAVNLAFWY